jgi:hypothetical protein
MVGSRSKVDFSEHQVNEIHSDNCKIWDLKKPGTNIYRVRFINSSGIMAVTGDLGNWIFCREFHPSADNQEKVSDGYWCEKLKISSTQNYEIYNAKKTEEKILNYIKYDIWGMYGEEKPNGYDKAINNFILSWYCSGDEFDFNIDSREMKKEISWLLDCLKKVHEGEHYYMTYAHENYPSHCDYESVISHYDIDCSLQVVFDAFEIVCQKLKESQNDTP